MTDDTTPTPDAADDQEGTPTPAPADAEAGPDSAGDSADLGGPGKRAIEAMKADRNKARRELADALNRLREYDDKGKSETQRLQEAAEEAKTRATTAEATYRKIQAALDRAPDGATQAQIKAVAKRLAGETDDELEADADELYALLGSASATAPTAATTRLPSKPTEHLTGGGDPTEEPDETDPRKLADLIGRH